MSRKQSPDSYVCKCFPNERSLYTNGMLLNRGKVFVFSGIIPICGDDDGLAAVLGHEISHNLAHHVGEKISKNVLLLVAAVAFATFFDTSFQSSQLLLNLILDLPNSRKQEVCVGPIISQH